VACEDGPLGPEHVEFHINSLLLSCDGLNTQALLVVLDMWFQGSLYVATDSLLTREARPLLRPVKLCVNEELSMLSFVITRQIVVLTHLITQGHRK
jgi:hypothetical protein